MAYSKEHQAECEERYLKDEFMPQLLQKMGKKSEAEQGLNAKKATLGTDSFVDENKAVFSKATNLYDIPSDDTTLLRYISWSKFLDLINNKRLWLSAPYKFEQDEKEGVLVKDVETYIKDIILKYYKTMKEADLAQSNRFSGVCLTGNENDDLEKLYNRFREVYDHNRKRFYISCWTNDDQDRDLMWAKYVKESESNNAVAIKTNVGKLKSSIEAKGLFAVTRIRYRTPPNADITDFDFINGVWSIVCYMLTLKRSHFSGDKEVRLMTDNLITNQTRWYKNGINTLLGVAKFDYAAEPEFDTMRIPVNVNVLIDSIILSPKSNDLFKLKVIKFLNEKGLHNVKIEDSGAKQFFT